MNKTETCELRGDDKPCSCQLETSTIANQLIKILGVEHEEDGMNGFTSAKDWLRDMDAVRDKRCGDWHLTKLNKDFSVAEMLEMFATLRQKEKESGVAIHIENAAGDGCCCEPCEAARYATETRKR